MSVTGDAKKIPSVFISKHYGEILKSGQYKIVFNHKMDNRKSDVADQLSDFQVGVVDNRWTIETRCYCTWWKYLFII